MKIILRFTALFFIFTLFACENDVELNTDFKEVTAVYGLLDAGSDTQYVKITRTFLDDNLSAVQLAGDPNNLYYDSLTVELEENGTGNVLPLSRIILPKENGIFTTERNEVYITDAPITPSSTYNLSIRKPDSSLTTGDTRVLNGLGISKPSLVPRNGRNVREVPLVNFRGKITPYIFEFSADNTIGEFEMELTFRYVEIINNDSTVKEFVFPVGRISNPENGSSSLRIYRVTFNSDRVFTEIEKNIPADPNAPKRFIPDNAFTMKINSADREYTLYRDVFGPLDGLSQTRPDYTNVTNGIGLFASRREQLFDADINDDTENFIVGNYGDNDDLAQFRNFQFP